MRTKPFSQTKNKGKLFLVAKLSGPLLARMPLNFSESEYNECVLKANCTCSTQQAPGYNVLTFVFGQEECIF